MGFFLYLLFGFLFSLPTVKSIFCVSFSAETITLHSEELLLSELSDVNHHLRNNKGRHLSHQFHMVIRHLVKRYHHIPPSVHPQYTQTQKIQQLKQHIKLLTQCYQVAR
jgi:hypothetical protein